MSLRRLALLLVLLLAAVAAGLSVFRPWQDKPESGGRHAQGEAAPGAAGPPRALLEKAELNRGVVLVLSGQPVEYALPASAHSIRLSTNASLKSLEDARGQRQQDPARRWRYALRVEELDAAGKLLRERTLHFQRDLVEIEMPGGVRGTGAFYFSGTASPPLATASARLELSGEARPTALRVSLVEADRDIADLLLRVHVPEPVSPRNAEAVWQRLSDEQRRRLASGNVFPPELLAEQERANLIASRWRPLGPSGAASSRDIYLLPLAEQGAVLEPARPAALATGPSRKAVIQLPEQGGMVRLRLEALNPAGPPAGVALRWYGYSAFERSSSNHDWHAGPFELRSRFEGGWLEVEAGREALVRAWMEENGQSREITPPIRYLRVFPAAADTPLDYSIAHAGDKPTPLRLVLRRMTRPGEGFADDPVQVEFLDEGGAVLRTSTLRPAWKASAHDLPWPAAPGSAVSDPVEVFFNVPTGVTRVRLHSRSPLIALAFTRPGALPRAVRTPEDTVSPDAQDKSVPGWFPLQPIAFETLVLNGASRVLAVQDRPPEDRPGLEAGEYTFEEFHPVAGGAARVFLAPREAGVRDRPEAVGQTYRPLPRRGTISLLAEPGRAAVGPHAAWIGALPGMLRYEISIDGRKWASGAAGGIAGETILPPLDPGRHRVRVAASRDVRWFITHIGEGPAWIKRSAQRFDGRLQFDVERTTTDEEFISVRLFRPAGMAQRMKVRVWVDAPRPKDPLAPMEGWLFTERVHDVRPSGEEALPIAETAGEKTDIGQPFYIPLPKGSPRGRYLITLTPEGGTGWISVSRIIPGRLARPRLIVEEVRRER